MAVIIYINNKKSINYSGKALYNSSLLAGGKFVGNIILLLKLIVMSPFFPEHLEMGIPCQESSVLM